MKYSIMIDVAKDVDTEYAVCANNACNEFLKLFPEHKNKFDIYMRYGNTVYNCKTGETKPYNPTISEQQLQNIADKNQYIKQADGRYLIPKESMEWYEQFGKRSDEQLNYGKISKPQVDWINTNINHMDSRYFHLGVTNKKLYNEEGLFGYGISCPQVGTFVSTSGFSQEQFKRLIWHEFGHVFGAVHSERDDITNTQYGEHCAHNGCVMRDVVYAGLMEANKPKLFCDDCIESMNRYLQTLTKPRTNENSLEIEDNTQELPDNREKDDNFKLKWREFAKELAIKTKTSLSEDKKDTNFNAKLVSQDGAYIRITASSANNVALMARDSKGNKKVPDMEVFTALAQKASKSGQAINFGDIKSAEFKARLLIACIENNPPITTRNTPKIDDDFLASIDTASANKLKTLQSKNTEKQENKKTFFEKTKDARKYLLEVKAKKNIITPIEKAELTYILTEEKRKQEKEDAIKRTGNEIDPRTAEHIVNSGLPVENYVYSSKSNRTWRGWKMHLDVVPNRNDPTTKAISEFLEELDIDHKIAKGGENGKGMTIYVGGHADASRLANELNSRFGKDITEPPIYTDQKGEEIDFNKTVTGRFYLQDIFQIQYPKSAIKGICPTDYGSLCDNNMSNLVTAIAIQENLISNNYVQGKNLINQDFYDWYIVNNLETYCAHKFYQKHLGDFYCGKDADKFEEIVFENKLPPIDSAERKKWNKIATQYNNILEQENSEAIKKMKILKNTYTPIDFSKAKPIHSLNPNSIGKQLS
ncbi:MAG: hypothetical protein E7012_00275 [Alphaproteobacteria bacterium]|nr:hypothetical protein [Alphaproteobacteria bacterium]